MEIQKTNNDVLEQFKELRLRHWGEALKTDLEEMTEQERQTVLKYLPKWISKEKTERKSQLIASRIRTAKFRKIQTIDKFNFQYSAATKSIEKNYLALFNSISRDFLPSAVFTGNAGLGKTHLARALGYASCQKTLSVFFVTAAEMVNHLTHAQKTFTLEAELARYRRPQVLIIDELGYVSLDTQGSNLFFQVISARHDQELGTIATTNIAFGKFNQIFANDAIAHAIVDRLANDADVFFLEGTLTYRPEERKEKLKRRKESLN